MDGKSDKTTKESNFKLSNLEQENIKLRERLIQLEKINKSDESKVMENRRIDHLVSRFGNFKQQSITP